MFDRNVHDKTYKSFSCSFLQEFEDTSGGGGLCHLDQHLCDKIWILRKLLAGLVP